MSWIDLPSTKRHLNKRATVTSDDDELRLYIDAACRTIEDLKGHVDVVDVVETVRPRPLQPAEADVWTYGGRQWMVDLAEYPVMAIDAVTSVAGGVAAVLNPLPPAAPSPYGGWSLIESQLFLPGPGVYTVNYRAGRDPVPTNYVEAALELVAHLWRGSQFNQAGGRPPVPGDQMMVVPHVASALPYRIRELLGIYGAVVNERVIIG